MKTRLPKLAVLAMALIFTLSMIAYALEVDVVTFAGMGESGYRDEVRAKATFTQPMGIAMDKLGAKYIVDTNANRIRKIVADQVLTLAGSGKTLNSYYNLTGGYADGPALNARFNRPRFVAIDSKGQVYVSDSGNHVIRKIYDGNVYTFAGTGKAGYKDGNPEQAQFNSPSGLAVDSQDNLYVADTLNHVIRKITPLGEVSTVAGLRSATGGYKDGVAAAARFNEPYDLCLNAKGVIFVADTGNQLIRKIENSTVSTYAGMALNLSKETGYFEGAFADGSVKQARFSFPKGICVAEDGTVFVADTWNNSIRAIKPNRETVTIAGAGDVGLQNGSGTYALFNNPTDVFYSQGVLYVSDTWNNMIRSIKINLTDLAGIKPTLHFDSAAYKPQIWMNGKMINFAADKPYMEKGAVIVPAQKLCESAGVTAKWDAKKRKLAFTVGGKTTTIVVSKNMVRMRNKVLYLPAKYLADQLKLKYEWAPQHQAVVLTKK